MAFVILQNDDAYRQWLKRSQSLGYPHTALAGNAGQTVLALPDIALEEMERQGIAFTTVAESQLSEHLSPGGLAYYQHLRQHESQHLYFDAPLPPAQHVALRCTVLEPHLNAVRQIVERYEPTAFRTEEVTVLSISAEQDEPEEAQAMVRVEFVIHRRHHEAIVQDLLASGAAGTSRTTAIYTVSDPDGPPRRATR